MSSPLPSLLSDPAPSFGERRQIAQLKRCEPISEQEVKQLCAKAQEILIEEGNVQYVDSPVTVSPPSLPSLLSSSHAGARRARTTEDCHACEAKLSELPKAWLEPSVWR